MDKMQCRAILAGLLFGIYPLFLSKSRISGNVMGATFSLVVCLTILPFALGEMKELAMTNWRMLIGAGIVSAMGLMCMTSYLALPDQRQIGLLIILMIITQATVTAVYQVYMDKGISLTRILGFISAAVAIVLLNKR